MILVRVPDSKRAFEGMKARGVLVKHVAGLHPLLANCLRLTVGTPDENTLMIDALKASLVIDAAPASPTSSATPRRRRSACASTSTAPAQAKLATGIGFFDHMLDQIARHGLIDLDIDAKGDLHIDGHHTVEDVGITLGQAVAKAVGDKARHSPLRPRLRAARRGAVARGGRFLRPAGAAHGRAASSPA